MILMPESFDRISIGAGLNTGGSNGAEWLTVKSTGNVGIGTTSPGADLHVRGGTGANELVQRWGQGGGSGNYNTLELYKVADTTSDWILRTYQAGGSQCCKIGFGKYSATPWDGAQLVLDTSDGKVGIGTTSPSGTLDVNGSILITGEASPTAGSGQVVFGKLSNDFYLGVASGEKLLRGFIGGDEKITIDESGKVGINTSSPSLPLHIQGTESRIRLESSAGRSYDIVSGGGGALFASSFGIQDSSASGAPLRLVIDSTGKVGLNESSPDYSLHITGVAPRTFVEGTRNGDNVAYIMQALASDGTARGGGYYLQPGTTDATTYLGLSADNSNYHMVVTRGSRVGIGTTTPQDVLEVIAGGAEGIHVRSASRPLIFFNTTGGTLTQGWGIEVTNEGGCAGCLGVREDTKSGSIRFVIQNDTGNVGIGTTNPTQKLEVSGNINVSGITTDAGVLLSLANNNLGGLTIRDSGTDVAILSDGSSSGTNGILRLFSGGTENVRIYASSSKIGRASCRERV